MSGMTYISLVADIQNYAERSDDPFVAQIPSFIDLAENRIASEDKPLGFLRTVTGTLSGDTLAKPARWRRTKNFSVLNGSERKYLKLRTYEYCRTYWPDSTVLALPEYYCDYDYEHFLIVGTPDDAYDFELQYYERPTPLSDTQQTSWTTQYAPQLLLYGALLEAMPFLKASERVQEFQGLYDRALQAIIKEDSIRIVDASA